LKAFKQKHYSHYELCKSQKIRKAKKTKKDAKKEKESNKRAKASFEIAGAYYADINKVKSKARAILNMRKDGERVVSNDEQFLKELLEFHEKGGDKLKDFDHFEVGQHPDYEKTRCFFVVKKNGSKVDFSISKCMQNLEKKAKSD
jgi:hypothetical protein